MYRRILLAYDGSVGAWEALRAAVALAREGGAALTALSIEAHLPHYAATVGEVEKEREAEERACRRWLAEAAAYAGEEKVPIETLTCAGHPAQVITRVAAERAVDLVVIGHSGHSRAWGHFLGGVTEKVGRHAPCSVLIVRELPAASASEAATLPPPAMPSA